MTYGLAHLRRPPPHLPIYWQSDRALVRLRAATHCLVLSARFATSQVVVAAKQESQWLLDSYFLFHFLVSVIFIGI